jgi:propanol-preferring alcohol dehydrogenase
VGLLPQTLGHEIAGEVELVGEAVTAVQAGDRVCLHYLATCGRCEYCRGGHEQFCPDGKMLGKHMDGGFAEYIAVPERNAVPLGAQVPYEHGAVMMCSSATSFHALRKGRLQPGETVAVYGAGGLGMSAIQLAWICGAREVFAVDIEPSKLEQAKGYGAVAIDAGATDPVAAIRKHTRGRGVDVALEVIGLRKTMEQAIGSLTPLGRAVLVGIASEPMVVDSYSMLLGREAEVIGSADHTLWELGVLVEYASHGRLDLSEVVTRTIPLEAESINKAMAELESYGSGVRTVIVP